MNFRYKFDLKGSLDRLFPSLSLDGQILYQGPFGLKFDIGLDHIDRAATIFNAVFRQSKRIVLLSEDSSWQTDDKRWFPLFALPKLFGVSEAPTVNSYEIHDPEDENRVVQWAIIKPSILAAERLFEAIANQDHGRTPSVRGRVHILDPSAEVLLHMYDDRGLDIIARSAAPLQELKDNFASWILWDKLDGQNKRDW